MKSIFQNILIAAIILCSASLPAQKPVAYDSPRYEYKLAKELFQKQKYGSAQQYFKQVYEFSEDKQQDLKAESYFYMGLCAAKLSNQDAAFLLSDFIRQYPVHAFVPQAHYHLGMYYFSTKQYKKVLEQFDEIDERVVNKDDLAEFRFKKGYSYFATGKYAEAKALLKQSSEENGPYHYRALYYLAHMAYSEKQYEAALEDFQKLQNVPEYKDEVQQYLMQIYFIQEQYDKVVAMAPTVMTESNLKNQPELYRTLALSYYNLKDFDNAESTFRPILNNDKVQLERNDYFAIGYTFYQNKKYDEAIKNLSQTTKQKPADEMTQNSYYLIADCYLQQKDYQAASQSFLQASKYNFIPDIQEDALYNHAKLQYETSSSPFNSAIKALEDYINKYPYSSRSQEANSYLASIYMSTKNYQSAINSLEKIDIKSPSLLMAYQRCTHFRALEMINNRNYKDALKMLNKSLTYPMDKTINTENLYWKAECEYRSEKYRDSYYSFQNYMKATNATADVNYNNAQYSYGYAALKLNKYSEAAQGFRKYLQKSDDVDIEADATARLADCYYMQKDLRTAIKYYEQCQQLGRKNADYAMFQTAKCYSYLNDYDKKIDALERLMSSYPKSSYNDDAEYELASTYHAQNEYGAAIAAYKNFILKYPKSPYIRQAHNKLAQSYLNTQDVNMAISTFKYVFETYPGSQEAKDALANLENIYSETGNTSDFFAYIKSRNLNISADKQDSISFKAAENKYMRGDCDAAIKGYNDYLRQFPNGLFAAKALYCKGDCEYGTGDYDNALASFEKLVNNYNTEYNETAYRKAASILYGKKEYNRALVYFKKLVEYASTENNIIYGNNGCMHCAYELRQYRDAYNAATNIMLSGQNDNDLQNEALMIAGKSAIALSDNTNALKYLTRLSKNGNNDQCAEAAYLVALIHYNDNNIDLCEKQIKEILASDYTSEYWYASTFILYGDVYLAKGNAFQARYTYQSIIDNYEGEDLKKVAEDKIAALDKMEEGGED